MPPGSANHTTLHRRLWGALAWVAIGAAITLRAWAVEPDIPASEEATAAPSATPATSAPAASASSSAAPATSASAAPVEAVPSVAALPSASARPSPAPPTSGPAKSSTEPPPADTKTEDEGPSRIIVPLVMYSPETHLGVGVLAVQFFRPRLLPKGSRASSVALVALVTTREQAVFELIPEIYWSREDYGIAGKLEYQRYPDSFWGIGPRTPNSAEERYERRRARWRGGPRRRVIGPLFAGLLVDAMWYHAIYTDPHGLFAREPIPGEAGGLTVGAGPSVAFDSRDNTAATRRGTLVSVAFVWFGRPIGSDYEFTKVILEARHFVPLGGEHVLGFRFAGEFQNGNVPYYHLAYFGGDELLRGYFLGRYRDRNLIALETEYRFPLVWKFGGTVFAGVAEVAGRPAGLDLDPVRWAGGGGLRFSLTERERLNLRLDVGAGPHTSGVYFTAREAF